MNYTINGFPQSLLNRQGLKKLNQLDEITEGSILVRNSELVLEICQVSNLSLFKPNGGRIEIDTLVFDYAVRTRLASIRGKDTIKAYFWNTLCSSEQYKKYLLAESDFFGISGNSVITSSRIKSAGTGFLSSLYLLDEKSHLANLLFSKTKNIKNGERQEAVLKFGDVFV